MNARTKFGKVLKEKVLTKQNREEIGNWAYLVYYERLDEMTDPNFDEILLTLNKMELGPEFAFFYEKLNEIADNLILGNEVNLEY